MLYDILKDVKKGSYVHAEAFQWLIKKVMYTRDIFYVIKSKGYFKYAWKCCLFSDSNYLSDKYTPKIVT